MNVSQFEGKHHESTAGSCIHTNKRQISPQSVGSLKLRGKDLLWCVCVFVSACVYNVTGREEQVGGGAAMGGNGAQQHRTVSWPPDRCAKSRSPTCLLQTKGKAKETCTHTQKPGIAWHHTEQNAPQGHVNAIIQHIGVFTCSCTPHTSD